MSMSEMLPVEDLFAYDPNRSSEPVFHNQSERECVRAIVDQELSLRFDESTLPIELKSLLNDAWKEVLAAIYIEDGFGSIRWMLAMEITDELLWTLKPKENLAERTKMIGMLPVLVKVLRQGLASVKWGDKQTDDLFNSLSRYHMSILSGDKAASRTRTVRIEESTSEEVVSAASHSFDMLDVSEFESSADMSSEGTEKGWVFRADTNEWIYQGEDIQQVAAGSESSIKIKTAAAGRARKMGTGDH